MLASIRLKVSVMVAFAFWMRVNRKSVLFSGFVVAAAVKERISTKTIIRIRATEASWLVLGFECKILYQFTVLIGCMGI